MNEITSAAQLRALLKRGTTYAPGSYRVHAEASGSGYLPIEAGIPLSVEFDDGFLWTGPSGSAYPAVGINCANVHLYGGKVTNPHGGLTGRGGDAVKVGSDLWATSVRWWGLVVDGAAANGVSVQGARYPIVCDLAAEVSRCGLDLSLDPHPVKGTGLHGCYIGGGAAPTDAVLDVYVHDQATGAGVQAGAWLRSGAFRIQAARITWPGAGAGAAFQPWGGHNGNVSVALSVDGAQYGIYAGSLTSGTFRVTSYARSNVKRADVLNAHVVLP